MWKGICMQFSNFDDSCIQIGNSHLYVANWSVALVYRTLSYSLKTIGCELKALSINPCSYIASYIPTHILNHIRSYIYFHACMLNGGIYLNAFLLGLCDYCKTELISPRNAISVAALLKNRVLFHKAMKLSSYFLRYAFWDIVPLLIWPLVTSMAIFIYKINVIMF